MILQRWIVIILACYPWQILKAQPGDTAKFHPAGNVVVQVINRTEYNISEAIGGMYINRSHFGYQYQFAPQWIAKVLVDAGRPTVFGKLQVSDSIGNSLPTNYNYKEGSYYTMTLKFSYLQWRPTKYITLQAGGILQNHYITQEKFWGYRYIFETFQDKYFSSPSGDLGAITYISPAPWISFDLALTNGEGFRLNQDTRGNVKWAAGIDLKPAEWIQFRLYADRKNMYLPGGESASQQVYSAFSGFRYKDRFRVGFEITRTNGYTGSAGRDLFGVSAFTAWSMLKKLEGFVRYDALDSNGLDGGLGGWNKENDGQLWLAGLHYAVVKGVNLSLNYRYHVAATNAMAADYSVLSVAFEYKLN
jgi:hypothetical protein